MEEEVKKCLKEIIKEGLWHLFGIITLFFSVIGFLTTCYWVLSKPVKIEHLEKMDYVRIVSPKGEILNYYLKANNNLYLFADTLLTDWIYENYCSLNSNTKINK